MISTGTFFNFAFTYRFFFNGRAARRCSTTGCWRISTTSSQTSQPRFKKVAAGFFGFSIWDLKSEWL